MAREAINPNDADAQPLASQPTTSDGSLDRYDQRLTDQCSFKLVLSGGSSGFGSGGREIYFQFPPKILNESNESLWLPIDVWAIEPVKIHKGSAGRKLTMEWEYLASSEIWTPERIGRELRLLKSYFYEFEDLTYPTVDIIYTQVIPVVTSFRFMNLSVTYSPELFGSGNDIHPLHSKVNTTLELATNIQVGLKGGQEQETVNAKGKQQQKDAKPAIVPWY